MFKRILVTAVIMALSAALSSVSAAEPAWTERELRILESLALTGSERVPTSPSNRFADDPEAAAFGEALFFDTRFSVNGQISCSFCHEPDKYFTDGLARSVGAGSVMRNAQTVVGAAFNRWFYWDGRRDSLWSQALIPFEAQDEMGSSRISVLRSVFEHEPYRLAYREVFGTILEELDFRALPERGGPLGGSAVRDQWHRLPVKLRNQVNRAYANIGKAIAAYERKLLPPLARFDRYVAALKAGDVESASRQLSPEEIAGARLFIDSDRTQCLQCHNGRLLTNGEFHNVGSGNFSGKHLDFGRSIGLQAVLMDEFNCLGPYSDAEPLQCEELRYLNRDSHLPLRGAFKVPSLRGLRQTAPYFHDGRFESVRAVLEFYSAPPDAADVGPHELRPLGLTGPEIAQLEVFLLTFSAD